MMGSEKESRTQFTGTGGAECFVPRENEHMTAHLNGRFHIQGGFTNAVISQVGHLPWESPEDSGVQPGFYGVGIQDSRMTLRLFVETKFVPEHVQYKAPAGQTHYQAILKHVITPEAVSRIFDPGNRVKMRLTAVHGWPYLDSIRLCDLRSEHVRRLVSAAENGGYSEQTVTHIKHVCFAIIAHAQKEGCFSGPNPASLVKLPKSMRGTPPALTPRQIRAVLDLLQYPDREVVLFGLTTGMSLPDICDLRWKDLNLDDRERFVDHQSVPARTVLVKAWWNRGGLGDSRTYRQNKIIALLEPLLSALRDLRKRNPDADPEDCVLVSEEGKRVIPEYFRVVVMKRVAKAVGMPSLSWQDLRRTHQAFNHSLRAGVLPVSLRPLTIGTSGSGMQALSRQDTPRQELCKTGSISHRAFCSGRRFRARTESASLRD